MPLIYNISEAQTKFFIRGFPAKLKSECRSVQWLKSGNRIIINCCVFSSWWSLQFFRPHRRRGQIIRRSNLGGRTELVTRHQLHETRIPRTVGLATLRSDYKDNGIQK